MESLVVVSDSSEEGILMAEIPRVPEVVAAEQLEPDLDIGDEDSEAFIAANEGEVPNENDSSKEVAEKRKKRPISSRRTRRVKLSDGDRVICEIAGVQVT